MAGGTSAQFPERPPYRKTSPSVIYTGIISLFFLWTVPTKCHPFYPRPEDSRRSRSSVLHSSLSFISFHGPPLKWVLILGMNDNLIKGEISFGINIMQNLDSEASFVFSPFSVMMSLCLVHAGAKETTKYEIREAVLPGKDVTVSITCSVLRYHRCHVCRAFLLCIPECDLFAEG